MSSDFHVKLPWSTESSPLDVLPYDIALQQLLHANVVSEDGLMDYALSQALRGLCFAVKAASRPLSRAPGSQPGAAVWVRGCEAVFDIMCRSVSAVPGYLPTISYLSKRLLCDKASNFGEGNERPFCTKEWMQVLLLETPTTDAKEINDAASIHGSKQRRIEPYFPSLFNTDRRVQLGYLWMLTGTLRLIALDPTPHAHLFSDHLIFVNGIVHNLLPRISTLADAKECGNLPTAVDPHGGGPDPSTPSDVGVALPSMLTIEANHFIIHGVHWLCTDVLAVYQFLRDGDPKTQKVLDRDAPLMLWQTVTLTRNALRRGLAWIQSEMGSIWLKEGGAAAPTHDVNAAEKAPSVKACSAASDPAACALLEQVSRHLEMTITRVVKTQEELNYSRTCAERNYGRSSKDYIQLTEVMWANTIQLCLMLQGFTRSWMVIHGGLGISFADSGFVLESSKDILRYIGGCILLIPSLEGSGSDKASLTQASHALLSALITLAAAAPLRSMQANLWMSDPECTRQIHDILVQRALRGRDEQLQQMAALSAGSILRSTSPTTDLSRQLTSEVSNQLLDVLSESRDAASHYAIEMLTVAIVQKPYALIPSLFRLLERGGAQTRRNVLDVLSALPNLPSSRAASGGFQGKASGREGGRALADLNAPAIVPLPGKESTREVFRLLAENLLTHLHDEELLIRMTSAALFGKVCPEDVFEPLLNLFLNTDSTGRKRSAVVSSLKVVLQSHTDDASVLLMFLQEAFRVNQQRFSARSSPFNPGASALSTNQPSSSSYHRKERVPTTPGDILTHSLLYTTNGTGEVESTQKPTTDLVNLFSSFSLPSDERVERALKGLTKSMLRVWAASVKEWRSETHIEPLLLFLQTVPNTTPGERFWYLANIKFLFEYLATSRKGSPGNGKGFVFPSHVATLALYNIFFSVGSDEKGGKSSVKNNEAPKKGHHSSTSLDGEVSWVVRMRSFIVNYMIKPHPIQPLLSDGSYQALLPLYFIERSMCEATTPLGTSTCSLAASSPDHDVQGISIQAILHKIWCAFWEVLTDKSYMQFWAMDSRVTEVVLDALYGFPAVEVFHELQVEMRSATSSEIQFFLRVFLCAISHYTGKFITLLTSRPSSPGKGNPITEENIATGLGEDCKDDIARDEKLVYDDMKACVNSINKLNTLMQTLIFPQVRKHLESSSKGFGTYVENIRKIISLSAMKAYGLLTLAYLLDKGLFGEAWSACAVYMCDSLKKLADCYRHEPQREGRRKRETSALPGHNTAEEKELFEYTETMATFCQNAYIKVLEFLHSSDKQISDLILRLLRYYLRPLIELSNAVCASQKRGPDSDYDEAFKCANLVLKSLCIAFEHIRKCLPPSFENPTNTKRHPNLFSLLVGDDLESSEDSSLPEGLLALFLAMLPREDQEALANFALGCVRFKKSPRLQTQGLKILSFLITQAGELFIDMKSEGNKDFLITASHAIRKLAYINSDKDVREHAEFLLRYILDMSP